MRQKGNREQRKRRDRVQSSISRTHLHGSTVTCMVAAALIPDRHAKSDRGRGRRYGTTRDLSAGAAAFCNFTDDGVLVAKNTNQDTKSTRALENVSLGYRRPFLANHRDPPASQARNTRWEKRKTETFESIPERCALQQSSIVVRLLVDTVEGMPSEPIGMQVWRSSRAQWYCQEPPLTQRKTGGFLTGQRSVQQVMHQW